MVAVEFHSEISIPIFSAEHLISLTNLEYVRMGGGGGGGDLVNENGGQSRGGGQDQHQGLDGDERGAMKRKVVRGLEEVKLVKQLRCL